MRGKRKEEKRKRIRTRPIRKEQPRARLPQTASLALDLHQHQNVALAHRTYGSKTKAGGDEQIRTAEERPTGRGGGGGASRTLHVAHNGAALGKIHKLNAHLRHVAARAGAAEDAGHAGKDLRVDTGDKLANRNRLLRGIRGSRGGGGGGGGGGGVGVGGKKPSVWTGGTSGPPAPVCCGAPGAAGGGGAAAGAAA